MDRILKPLKTLTGKPVTLSSDPEGEIIALDPDSYAKYVFVVEVGDLAPGDTADYLKEIAITFEKFLGPDRVLLVPKRSNQDPVQIFELEPVAE